MEGYGWINTCDLASSRGRNLYIVLIGKHITFPKESKTLENTKEWTQLRLLATHLKKKTIKLLPTLFDES